MASRDEMELGNERPSRIVFEQAQANYVEFHPSSTCIGAALANGVVKIYETRMRKVLQLYEIHEGAVNCLSFHTTGNYLVTASQEGTLKVLDLMEGRPSYTLYGSKSPVLTVKFSASGDHFATGPFMSFHFPFLRIFFWLSSME